MTHFAKVAIVCNRETIAPTIAPTIARIVALRTTIGAIVGAMVGAMVGAIVSRLQTIATFAAAPLVPAPLPGLKHKSSTIKCNNIVATRAEATNPAVIPRV